MAVGYASLTGVVCVYEARRIRASGPDVVTVFISIFVLQCCLPGVVVFASLPFADPLNPTGHIDFDRILARLDLPAALLVLGLTGWFVFFFYTLTALMSVLLRRLGMQLPRGSHFVVRVAAMRLVGVLAFGTALTFVSFWLLGDTLVERYRHVILIRELSEDVEITSLNAHAFALMQSWGWLSVPALFVIQETRGRGVLWYVCLGCAIAFAILSASRRAIFIPILLAYQTFLLFDGRWRLKWILAASIPVLVWVGFGKEILSTIASDGGLEAVGGRYSTIASAVIRTATDMGITVMESWGTINLMDLDTRFGVDHLLSFFRVIPFHWLGWDPDLPTRVVRLSTAAFSTSTESDIPPGLFGQMWLDFGVFGPLFWAFIFAVQVSFLQRIFSMTIVTRQAAAGFVLITFVISLALNSGSFDFTFSLDILALLLAMLLTFKLVRVRLTHANSCARTPDTRATPVAPATPSANG